MLCRRLLAAQGNKNLIFFKNFGIIFIENEKGMRSMSDCCFVNCCSPTGEIISPISDVLNINHERGPYRTHTYNYNCFGYAFGTYTWLHPFATYSFIDERRDDEGW